MGLILMVPIQVSLIRCQALYTIVYRIVLDRKWLNVSDRLSYFHYCNLLAIS